jgi:hypothetical protein
MHRWNDVSRSATRVGTLFVGASLILVVAIGTLLAVNPTRAEQGLSDQALSAQQSEAASVYFLDHEWKPRFVTSVTRSGCASYTIASRHTGRVTIAYTEVLCQQCPVPDGASAMVPAAFRFDGDLVRSMRVADADGDPEFFNQVKKIFPSSLWAAAHQQEVPHVERLSTAAQKAAGC